MKKRSFLATDLLCAFFGVFGLHRFYTGYIGLGILQLLSLGGLLIWYFIDFFMISIGKYKDADGQELDDYNPLIGYGFLLFVIITGIIKFNLSKGSPV